VPDKLAGRSTRCTHCRNLVIVPGDRAAAVAVVVPEAEPHPAVVVEAGGLSADGLPAEFATLSAADGRSAEDRRQAWQRITNRIRIALIVGGVAGTTAGAALGAGLDGNLETMAGRAAGAFIGLLLGLSIGVIIGLLQAAESRKSSAKKVAQVLADLAVDGRAPNLIDLLMLVFGLAGAQSLRRLDAGDFVLVGVLAGAVAGAAVGAELAQQGLEMNRPGWLGVVFTAAGGVAGVALTLLVVYLLWRPWRGLGQQVDEGAVRVRK